MKGSIIHKWKEKRKIHIFPKEITAKQITNSFVQHLNLGCRYYDDNCVTS